MIKYLSIKLTKYLEKNNVSLNRKDLLKIQYSLEVLLGDLSKAIIIFLIFLYLNKVFIFFLSFIILNSTRTLMGGFHCKTYTSCLLLSIIYFLGIELFSTSVLVPNIYLSIIFFIISFLIIWTYAPCPNEYRPIKNKKRLKILSLISLTFWCILFFSISNTVICNCIFLSLVIETIQVFIITLKSKFYK